MTYRTRELDGWKEPHNEFEDSERKGSRDWSHAEEGGGGAET